MSTLLFGVKPHDFRNFALSSAMLMLIALAASIAPALSAMRTDPCVALRSE
jgi:ABC-type lipoprotein release transport system permease subunit